MTAKSTTNSGSAPHQDVLELLPWYVNGTLGKTEVARVEAHVRECPECARELEQCRTLAREVNKASADIWQPSATHLTDLMRQVESTNATVKSPRGPGVWLKNALAWLDLTPGPARWALGLQSALVLTLAIVLLVQPAERPVYQTMSSEAPQPSSDLPMFKMVFADDITEKELRGLLQSVDGEIVAGPSAIGVYTVRIRKSDTPEQLQQVLMTLRAHAKVKLAEEIHP